MTPPGSVVIVGESIAGLTAARQLRLRGHDGTVAMIGGEPIGAYARPPLSKEVLRSADAETNLVYPCADLGLDHVRSPAVGLDTSARVVATEDGREVRYDALLVATGAEARRLAGPGQRGEVVLRTLEDARRVRTGISSARSVVVVGAGFLGMEIASACVAAGVDVTVVDTEPPLRRLLGTYLSEQIAERAAQRGVRLLQAEGPVRLAGNPVCAVTLPDGSRLSADLVVTCAGDVPSVGWLAGTALADPVGVPIDEGCATTVPGVFAAGDVAYLRAPNGGKGCRAPFWSNAVAQGKVAAASILGQQSPHLPTDDYFWTEILDVSLKLVGPLPADGEPTSVEGDVVAGDAIVRWERQGRRPTVAAIGRKVPIGRLRAMAREHDRTSKESS